MIFFVDMQTYKTTKTTYKEAAKQMGVAITTLYYWKKRTSYLSRNGLTLCFNQKYITLNFKTEKPIIAESKKPSIAPPAKPKVKREPRPKVIKYKYIRMASGELIKCIDTPKKRQGPKYRKVKLSTGEIIKVLNKPPKTP